MAKKIVLLLLLVNIFNKSFANEYKEIPYKIGELFNYSNESESMNSFSRLFCYKEYEYSMKVYEIYFDDIGWFNLVVDDDNYIRLIYTVPMNVIEKKNIFYIPEGYSVYSSFNEIIINDIKEVKQIPFIGTLYFFDSEWGMKLLKPNEKTIIHNSLMKVDCNYFYFLAGCFENHYFTNEYLQKRNEKINSHKS